MGKVRHASDDGTVAACTPSADLCHAASCVTPRVPFLTVENSLRRHFICQSGRMSSVEPSKHSGALSSYVNKLARLLVVGGVALPGQRRLSNARLSPGAANFPAESEGNIIKGSFPFALWRWLE